MPKFKFVFNSHEDAILIDWIQLNNMLFDSAHPNRKNVILKDRIIIIAHKKFKTTPCCLHIK